MPHQRTEPVAGGSVLGPQHTSLARQMTWQAAAAALAFCLVLGLLCMPLVLVFPVGLVVYGASEAVFAVIYWYRYLLLSYQPIKHRPLSHDPISALQRTLQHLYDSGADIREYLSIWFHGAPVESIKRGNVRDLIAYAFWYKTPADVTAEGRGHELEQQVATIEAMWGMKFPAGNDSELTCMAHLWEPMKHWYKPLAFYVTMEAAALLCRVALQAAGFQRHEWMGLAYYTRNMSAQQIRPSTDLPAGFYRSSSGMHVHQPGRAASLGQHRSRSSEQVPLVLLHGVGMGLVPYISVLFNMAATGRPVLAVELPHISQRWVLWVPTVDEVTEVVVSILNRNAITSCCLVGHSYGTAVASRLLQQAPHRIQQLCLVDPICFTMFMPNLLRNFLYESPRSGNLLGDFMMVSAARDLHVAATLSRRFFWSEVNLWEEQVPPGTLVVLSGRDALMAAPQVRAWLQKQTQAVVMFNPDLVHAGFLMDIPWQQQILQQLLQLLDSRTGRRSRSAQTHHPTNGGHQGGQAAGGYSNRSSSKDMGRSVPDAAPAAAAGGGGQGGHGLPRGAQGVKAARTAATAALGASRVGDASQSTSNSLRLHQPVGEQTTASSSSTSSSVQSFESCTDSSSDSTARSCSNGPPHAAAAAGSQPHLAASPFSSAFTFPSADVSTDRLPAAGSVGAGASGKLVSHGSLDSNTQLLSGYHLCSGEGSLELASSLCMRSWSGVLPSCAATAAAAGSTVSATETTGVPESPRSWSTFVSASSVQSKRSSAAAAAALEARQAAQMLLRPLMALQQLRNQHHQHPQGRGGTSSERVAHMSHKTPETAAAAAVTVAAAAPAAREGEALRQHVQGEEHGDAADVVDSTATAGVDCLVYRGGAQPTGKDSGSAPSKVHVHDAPLGAAEAAAAAAAGAKSAAGRMDASQAGDVKGGGAAAAVVSSNKAGDSEGGAQGIRGLRLRPGVGRAWSGPKSVLERVEGLLQGRGAQGAASRKGSRTL